MGLGFVPKLRMDCGGITEVIMYYIASAFVASAAKGLGLRVFPAFPNISIMGSCILLLSPGFATLIQAIRSNYG